MSPFFGGTIEQRHLIGVVAVAEKGRRTTASVQLCQTKILPSGTRLMHQPQPQIYTFNALINDIETGVIKIPQFQQEYVWNRLKTAKLIDSIIKGYPIGTFILWKTKDSLRSLRNVGSLKLPATPEGDATQYVLDGQQRITSLYASIKGSVIEGFDYADLYVDLDAPADGEIVITDRKEYPSPGHIKLTSLLEANVTVVAAYASKYHQTIQNYRDQIRNYQFSAIVIQNVGIDVATEVFTRINTSGKDLTVFEIMVAKTFSDSRDFDLSVAFDSLRVQLSKCGYGTVPPITLLQLTSALITDDCSTKAILNLKRDSFIDNWPKAVDALQLAVDYLRMSMRIPVSELLPYNAVLVLFAYFFSKSKSKPVGEIARYLQDLFWRACLGGRYTNSVESKLVQDIKRVNLILQGQHPTYDWPVDTSAEFLGDNGYFNAGRSYIKALLCILAYQQPKSFNDNALVNINNDWLKRANSKNYHHFFPKAALKRLEFDDEWANHIANITFVDDHLNKAVIGAKKPSIYVPKLKKINPDLKDTLLQSHLIDLENDGIFEDDYETFYYARVERLAGEIKKRVISQRVDNKGQLPIEDEPDYVRVEPASPEVEGNDP